MKVHISLGAGRGWRKKVPPQIARILYGCAKEPGIDFWTAVRANRFDGCPDIGSGHLAARRAPGSISDRPCRLLPAWASYFNAGVDRRLNSARRLRFP